VLGEDPHDHLPQQSIRTLACTDVPQRAYLKLSLSILNTSTTRVLAPHTVGNAAPISDWLRRVVDGDAYLRDELRPILLGEVMGTSVEPAPGLLAEDTYGALACSWRVQSAPASGPGRACRAVHRAHRARARRHPIGGLVGGRARRG